MLFRRAAPGCAELWDGKAAARPVPFDFAFVSTVRYCGEERAVLVSAVPHGGRIPEVRSGVRGDLRLFRLADEESSWQKVGPGYAHDPVCLPGGRFAVHRGSAVCVLAPDGTLERDVHRRRFSWGPPSLSVSPGRVHLAFVSWRGDDRLLCSAQVGQVGGHEGLGATQHRGPIDGYCWLDSATLLAAGAKGMRTIDAATGASSTFRGRWRVQLAAAPGLRSDAAALLRLPAPEVAVSLREVCTAAGAVWLLAHVHPWAGGTAFKAVVRLAADGSATSQLEIPEASQAEWFTMLGDGTLVVALADYEDLRVVRRRVVAQGNSRAAVEQGWRPLPTCQTPQLGFPVMPE